LRLILASNSPRRKELLGHTGVKFEVMASTYHENDRWENPEKTVEMLAFKKGEEVFHKQLGDVLVISADTIVVLDGEIFNKPDNREHARQMLSRLSGRQHQVMTSVAFFYRNNNISHQKKITIKTSVKFKSISSHLLDLYLATGEGDDKAGSYGIQAKGLLFVDTIEGSYANVVGFPLSDIVLVLDQIALELGRKNYQDLFKA
jgi:septum formation protein